ncbi:MAG TPA: LysR substrate-binding domain-containing protein, partial [Dongiaceae bacterium]|nr:LysR substrate-binding domain-containing protein [Dongiaceae bacterium]
MAINFNLNDLQAFRAVAELKSFRKAAETLHLSQPAFSRRIEKLEEALGVRLLDRTSRRVSLTSVGRDFDRKVQQLLDDLDHTLLGIRGVAATRMGEVTIACVPSTVYYFLSQVISRYHERYPKIRVKVFDASANEVLSAVSRGEADFGLNFVGGKEADIEFKPLLEERFVAACRRDHPLAKKRRVSWTELGQYDYISV